MPNSGLYVHVPFCKSKCPYCGFYSIASTSLIPTWLNAFKKEVAHYKDRPDLFDSLYIGGGTPSLLALKDIETIFENLLSNLSFAPRIEITIEANPGDITKDKAKGLRAMGVNRINLGVQAFDDRCLSFLGRRHKTGDSENALRTLRFCGFGNIGMDLIYGIEGQSLAEWLKTLKKALEFNPEHISCYQLTFEENTPFLKKKEKNEIEAINEEAERKYFITTSEFLEHNGYIHYEISNFASQEHFYSRHNSKYWDHTPYLGLGPSAHSFDGRIRWWNHASVPLYSDYLERGVAPVEGEEKLTDEQIKLEALLLGLRTKGGVRFSDEQYAKMRKAIESLIKSGHLRREGGVYKPTLKGFLIADHLPLLLESLEAKPIRDMAGVVCLNFNSFLNAP